MQKRLVLNHIYNSSVNRIFESFSVGAKGHVRIKEMRQLTMLFYRIYLSQFLSFFYNFSFKGVPFWVLVVPINYCNS